MLDRFSLGLLLLLLGSGTLLAPGLLGDWLTVEDAALAGLALITLGASLALARWRADLADEPFQGYAALRQFGRGKTPGSPARRMKIRIRCAR